jgi:hypothetical protein
VNLGTPRDNPGMSAPPPRRETASPRELAVRRAVMARDAGLRRIGAVTRWVLVGSLALAGALALIASHAFHGRTATNTSASAPAAVNQPPSDGPDNLTPATAAPTVTPSAPVAVSGGS